MTPQIDELYKDFMQLVTLPDDERKFAAMKHFFNTLKMLDPSQPFNWASDVFENIHVKERGNQLALIWANLETWEEKRLTYKEFAVEGNRLLNLLREYGVGVGDGFYRMVPLIPEAWISTWAAIKGGIMYVPTATTLTGRELEYRFKRFPPAAVIADKASAELFDATLKTMKIEPKVKVIVGGEKPGWVGYEQISEYPDEAEPAITSLNTYMANFFTSGTTGPPKEVIHTMLSYPVGHLSTAYMINVHPGDIHQNLSAPGWAKFEWSSFFSPFNVGATTTGFLIPGPFRNYARRYLEAIAKYRVSTWCAPPSAWKAIVTVDVSGLKFEALREIVSAGEPLEAPLAQALEKMFGLRVRDFYGQTESTAMMGNPAWLKKIKYGSIFTGTPMYDVVLVDENLNEVKEPGRVGQIAVRLDKWRATGLFKEYRGMPEKMGEVFVGKYYLTGDSAFFDDDGYFWITGRADDVMKIFDYRVGPYDVESVLLEHPAVMETGVVARPHPRYVNVIHAFIVLKPSYQPSKDLAKEIFTHCIKNLPYYKVPRVIEFVPELPKTVSLKTMRYVLRNRLKERKERVENEYFWEDFPELREVKGR
ncbi:MAG: acyl-CoA synthetase [Candidatus Bathyarchaeota archaeon]